MRDRKLPISKMCAAEGGFEAILYRHVIRRAAHRMS